MATLLYTGTLTVTSCWCGIHLAIPNDLYGFASRTGKAVFCPLGHEFVYNDPEYRRLKREAEEARTLRENAERALIRERSRTDQARADAEHQRSRVKGYQGALAKTKKRAAAGVCPVAGCKRSFVNVARHVERQHPEFAHSEHEVAE